VSGGKHPYWWCSRKHGAASAESVKDGHQTRKGRVPFQSRLTKTLLESAVRGNSPAAFGAGERP